LPKEEYAKLSSTIMTRQHTYGRPSFDYAFTFDNFYVYDYLGDGESVANFALPIIGNEEIIRNITTSIDNGTINSSRSLDTLIKEIRLGKRGDIAYNADALKKYKRYRGIHIRIPSREYNEAGGLPEISGTYSRGLASRGESGNSNESGNQELTQTLTTANGDMVANVNEAQGQALFSLRTYREGGRDVLADFLGTRVSDGALTEAEAQDMMQQMDDIYAFCETMKDHYAPFGQWSEAMVRISAR
jgi:hypothetical protein